MTSKKLAEYDELSMSERILVLQDLWDEIASEPDDVPVTAMQKTELNRRLARHKETPDEASVWVDVKRRVRSKK